MSKRSHRNHAPEFNAKVASAAERNDDTRAALAQRLEVRAGKFIAWRDRFVAAPADAFAEGGRRTDPPVEVKSLHAKIGELALENDLLEHVLGKAALLRAKR